MIKYLFTFQKETFMTKAACLITKGQYKRAFKLLISQSIKAAEAFRGLAAQEVRINFK